jgi:cell division protein FtsQ
LVISAQRPTDATLRSRLTRRFTARPSRRLVVVAVTLTLGGALWGLVAVSRGSWFDARDVTVSGAGHLTAARVRHLAEVGPKTNVPWFDEAAAETRLEADPWIERADVSTSWPWTIHITVVERVPVAVAERAGETQLVAADGTILGTAATMRGLPRIELPPTTSTTGERPPAAGAASALGAMSDDLRASVSRIVVATDGTLEVHLRDGTLVAYGDATDLVRKADVVERALAWAGTTGAGLARISVTAPSAPAVVLAP